MTNKEKALAYLDERKEHWENIFISKPKQMMRALSCLHLIKKQRNALIMKNKLTDQELKIVKTCFIDLITDDWSFRIKYE